MEIIGYLALLVAGISIGLIGAGGGILSVPILVYLFGIHPVLATAYSLFIVGSTSLLGVIPKYLERNVSLKIALLFGLPSMVTVFIARSYIIHYLPDVFLSTEDITLSKSSFLLLFFSILMLLSARSMLRGNSQSNSNSETLNKKNFYFFIPLLGALEGLITGMVGAGGGFIIIPILTLIGGIPIKKAIGTSLLIISVKSLFGFYGDTLVSTQQTDWRFLLSALLCSVVGMFLGIYLSKKMDGSKLKSTFGVFILLMGIYILIKELLNVF